MIVIGTDTHKASHTVAAVDHATGRVLADHTVRAKRRSFEDLLRWARGVGGERVWALEDCRHVSGAIERFLLARGEQVVRVAPKLTAGARDSARERGKSDLIDAVAIARAAIREGLDTLPVAKLAGIELDIRLLVDHRQRLVATRTRLINDLRWHLHDLWPELEIPTGGLIAVHYPERLAGRLARAEQTARVRIARDELRRIRELTRTINELESELAPLVAKAAPRLLAERGCGVLIAAKLVGEIAGITRFPTDAKLARIAGSAPIPAQLGQHDPPPPRPRRQPPDQLRPVPPRAHQEPPRPRHRRLPRPQTSRRQNPPRGHALPQTTPRPPRLAPPTTRHPATPTSPNHPLQHPPQQLRLDIGATRQAIAGECARPSGA